MIMYALLTLKKTDDGISMDYSKKLYTGISSIIDDLNSTLPPEDIAVYVKGFESRNWGHGFALAFPDVLLRERCKGIMAGSICTSEIYIPIDIGLGCETDNTHLGTITKEVLANE